MILTLFKPLFKPVYIFTDTYTIRGLNSYDHKRLRSCDKQKLNKNYQSKLIHSDEGCIHTREDLKYNCSDRYLTSLVIFRI